MTDRPKAIAAVGMALAYLLTVFSIYILAPDRLIEPEQFPEKCPEESRNCSMIGPNSYRSEGITELRFNSSLESVMSQASSWVRSEHGTTVLMEWPGQSHAVFRSLLFRFPDDFVIKGFCDQGDAVIHVYSESRLGISDLGVNKERVQRFAEHMSSVEMPTLECSER
jgi:uncharacterized protein (DUF1499 family)